MKSTTLPRRAFLAGVTAVTALVLTAACGGDMGGMDHGAKPTTAGSATFTSADVTFAQMMIPHHQQAVTMATLAETRAADPELKRIAAAIKDAQAPEITTMTGWLSAWKQPTTAAGGHDMGGMPGMLTAEELAALTAASGVAFDRLFARGMIAHHNGAIAMARDEQSRGGDADARALAAAIEKGQTAEVAALRKILDRL
ncbi:lipoprotein [Longispora fulva]|uniref:Uncharacterized protein (DUF305 family) n=1 Tax=Longispora fulva TaxID=619741 RepID=A0A8J7GHS1_9ACTN|nr:DUF305 domain-containing protein [Longispora fulva]MBG6137030.1 uncharacterized protein (DUF305 family) [Longispora fulva]GIG61616.1 lipoprotein [Longispora fulva]